MIFRCYRAVDVSLLLLVVEKSGSCGSLELSCFSKIIQILSLALAVVLFDVCLALSLFEKVLLYSLPPLIFSSFRADFAEWLHASVCLEEHYSLSYSCTYSNK